MKSPTLVCVLTATITGCAMAPAPVAADEWPPGTPAPAAGPAERLAPGDLLGYRPAPSAVTDWPMDPPLPAPAAGLTLLASWRGAPEGFSIPGLSGPGLGSRAGGNNNGGNLQTGGNGGGNNGCGNGNSGPSGGGCNRPDPPDPDTPGVPGPVPLLGAGVAFGWARRMRRRVRL